MAEYRSFCVLRWIFDAFAVRAVQLLSKNQSVRYGIFQVSQTLLNFGLTLILVVSLGLGWEGRLWGQSAPLILFGLLAIVLLRSSKLLNLKFRKDYIRDALNFGLPLIPNAIGIFILGNG